MKKISKKKRDKQKLIASKPPLGGWRSHEKSEYKQLIGKLRKNLSCYVLLEDSTLVNHYIMIILYKVIMRQQKIIEKMKNSVKKTLDYHNNIDKLFVENK